MAGVIEGVDRGQSTLFPDRLEDWVGEDHLVRVVDLFVEELDLSGLGFERTSPARTGRPGYHPVVLLKLFIYGYLNHVPSSRRLEREAGRNVELMWLTGRLAPDHKTIADFRRDNGPAIRKACAQFVELCRRIGVLKGACVAIDGSKFKAVNNRDRNFTNGKIASRLAHLEADLERYIDEMVRIDRQEEGEARAEKVENLGRRYGRIRQEIQRLFVKADFHYEPDRDVYRCPAGNELTYRYTREEGGLQVRRYWTNDCQHCPLQPRCTSGKESRITRWEHEHLVDEMRERLSRGSDPMTLRRCTVEHPFGTIKAWIGAMHFQMRRLKNVRTEMALHVLAYNIKRTISLVGVQRLLAAIPG